MPTAKNSDKERPFTETEAAKLLMGNCSQALKDTMMIAALTVGLRGSAALGGLLLIPLAVPLLVFGAGSLAPGGETGVALTAAVSLVLLAVAPFAGGAAVRAARG